MSNKIRVLYLTSGHTVLARVRETEDVGTVELHSPIRVELVGTQDGKVATSLMPFGGALTFCSQTDVFPIKEVNIIASTDADPQMEQQWMQATSGIQLA